MQTQSVQLVSLPEKTCYFLMFSQCFFQLIDFTCKINAGILCKYVVFLVMMMFLCWKAPKSMYYSICFLSSPKWNIFIRLGAHLAERMTVSAPKTAGKCNVYDFMTLCRSNLKIWKSFHAWLPHYQNYCYMIPSQQCMSRMAKKFVRHQFCRKCILHLSPYFVES